MGIFKRNWASFVGSVFLLVLILSCGVKERTPIAAPAPLSTGSLPEGVMSTKAKKFLIRASTSVLAVGEQKINYKMMTSEIDLLNPSDYKIQVRYWMPKMPDMPVAPAKIDFSKVGEVQIVYDISMAGSWEFAMEILKNGATADSLNYSYEISE